jgi:hypothetical protein
MNGSSLLNIGSLDDLDLSGFAKPTALSDRIFDQHAPGRET